MAERSERQRVEKVRWTFSIRRGSMERSRHQKETTIFERKLSFHFILFTINFSLGTKIVVSSEKLIMDLIDADKFEDMHYIMFLENCKYKMLCDIM